MSRGKFEEVLLKFANQEFTSLLQTMLELTHDTLVVSLECPMAPHTT